MISLSRFREISESQSPDTYIRGLYTLHLPMMEFGRHLRVSHPINELTTGFNCPDNLRSKTTAMDRADPINQLYLLCDMLKIGPPVYSSVQSQLTREWRTHVTIGEYTVWGQAIGMEMSKVEAARYMCKDICEVVMEYD